MKKRLKKNKIDYIRVKRLKKFLTLHDNINSNFNVKTTIDFKLLFGIFILSMVILSYEIIVSRISSLIFSHNYAFVIVSLAILGLGCGGIFTFYKWNQKELFNSYIIYNKLSFYSNFFAISLFLFIILIILIPFFTISLFFFVLSFIPFFFAGIVLSTTFQSFAQASFVIYAFDLLGAATGTILTIWILSKFGVVNSILFLSILCSIASLLFLKINIKNYIYQKFLNIQSILATICIILLVAIFITNIFFGFLDDIHIKIRKNAENLNIMLNNPKDTEILESRWSAFGRTDFVKYKNYDSVRYLFIDGAAGTPMIKFDGNIKNTYNNKEFLNQGLTSAFPFLYLSDNEKNNMLVIGPGGGGEILLGLVNNISIITGVEVNRDFINIVREYKNYNGGIYTDFKNVNIIAEEGRSFIKGSRQKFDIIMMTLPVTDSSRSFEGYALTENYLFTTEAIKEYINHLTEEGSLIVVLHNTDEILRFVVTSLAALKDNNIDSIDAMNHIYTVGRDRNPILVIKKNPFTFNEAKKIYESIYLLKPDIASSFIPHISQGNMIFNNALENLSQGKITLKDLIKESLNDISPTKDDKPFFFKNERYLPKNILAILIIAALINFLVMIIYIKHKRTYNIQNKLLLLFTLLGLGFMMIEVSFFQKLNLFMGSPTISLATTLGSLLIGMGIGSFVSKRLYPNQNEKRLVVFCFIIFIVTIGLFFLISFILNRFLEVSISIKVIISSLILIPTGFILGIPFPTAVNLMKQLHSENSITWMYGINGTMSVLGSIIAIAVSVMYGFSISLILGTLCYLSIALIFLTVRVSKK